MPLLERVRVETYIPDLRSSAYQNLLFTFEEEFTYACGGCTILRGLDGSYLSHDGRIINDRVNLIYTDLPLAFSVDFKSIAYYADVLRKLAFESLAEEAVIVAVTQVYHSVGPRSRNIVWQKPE
ncbi:MAG TPA: hypothetical protein VJM12_20650 [Pyrinomonadaceae bacterium]|nr:hypothetical protein [Pyrinomonadaceae bacterium]